MLTGDVGRAAWWAACDRVLVVLASDVDGGVATKPARLAARLVTIQPDDELTGADDGGDVARGQPGAGCCRGPVTGCRKGDWNGGW